MIANPFESFQIEIPRKYHEAAKKYCRSGGENQGVKTELTPFFRQVDFWFFSFCLAVKEDLSAEKELDTVNIIPGSILSNDSYRLSIIQLCFIGSNHSLDGIADHRAVFNWAQAKATAGMPRLLQILADEENSPVWNLIEYCEDLT